MESMRRYDDPAEFQTPTQNTILLNNQSRAGSTLPAYAPTRSYDDPAENEPLTQNTLLLQRIILQPSPTVSNQSRLGPAFSANNDVAYAQIMRPARIDTPDSESAIDFRLQTPAQHRNASIDDNASPLMSGGSSISSGYIDLTVPSTRVQRRNNRPTSPETSF